jgi:DNA-binding XRE family transcriptional regulator
MKNLTVTKNVQMIDHAATGQRVRTLRKKAGLTQLALATKMGMSNSFLSELEKGSRCWTPELLSKVSPFLKK